MKFEERFSDTAETERDRNGETKGRHMRQPETVLVTQQSHQSYPESPPPEKTGILLRRARECKNQCLSRGTMALVKEGGRQRYLDLQGYPTQPH